MRFALSSLIAFIATVSCTALAQPEMRVLDDKGTPVANAEGNIMAVDKLTHLFNMVQSQWTTGSVEGQLRWNREDFPDYLYTHPEAKQATYEAVVRAPDYAWASTSTLIASKDASKTEISNVILPKGKELTLTLIPASGTTIPDDLLPAVSDAQHFPAVMYSLKASSSPEGNVWYQAPIDRPSGDLTSDTVSASVYNPKRLSLANVAKADSSVGTGATFKFRVPMGNDAPDKLYVLIDHPGFLRAFYAGPFAPVDYSDGKLQVQLPAARSASLQLKLPPGKDWGTLTTTGSLLIYRNVRMLSDWNTMWLMDSYEIGPQDWSMAKWEANDLAPGFYSVMVEPNMMARGNTLYGGANVQNATSATATVMVTTDTNERDPAYTKAIEAAMKLEKPIADGSINQQGEVELRVLVTDPDDNPVTAAEAIVMRENGRRLNFHWRQAGSDGIIPLTKDDVHLLYFQGEPMTGRHAVIVRAPGYAASSVVVDIPTSATVPVKLSRGQKVRLSLLSADGTPAPTTIPLVLVPKFLLQASMTSIYEPKYSDNISIANAKPAGPGMFDLQLPEDPGELYLMVDAPGFIRSYISEPITSAQIAKEGGQLQIQMPRTGSMDLTFQPPPGADFASLPYSTCGVEISRKYNTDDGKPALFQFTV